MTPKQHKLYIGTWVQVKKVLMQIGGMDAKEADAERHLIHIAALGHDKSSKYFTNQDLDRVLDQFQKRLINVDHSRPARSVTQPKNRLLWRITSLGFSDDEIRGMAARNFEARTDFENFGEAELVTLRTMLVQWARQKTREQKK